MFTGIVECVGEIRRIEQRGSGARIEIKAKELDTRRPLLAGQSVSVNGCCLTVTEARVGIFTAHLSRETILCTSFKHLTSGSRVNLERPLQAGEELGGHLVLGHVDGVGRIERLSQEVEGGWLSVQTGTELERYIAMKGSVAIDGISLTVAGAAKGFMEFAIVPFTFTHTNLHEKREGDFVNVEIDVLARYLENLTKPRADLGRIGLTLTHLMEEGF